MRVLGTLLFFKKHVVGIIAKAVISVPKVVHTIGGNRDQKHCIGKETSSLCRKSQELRRATSLAQQHTTIMTHERRPTNVGIKLQER